MKISILIPCHNEEKSVRSCINSCLDQTRPFDQILAINDGSTDSTLKILQGFGKKIQVLNIRIATGNKSFVQERGLEYITGDVMVTTDGDTILDKNFVKNIEKDFQDKKVAAVAGYVRSIRYNWVTLCRAFDYCIGQNVHKLAQNYLGYLFVLPGAASAFRMEVFRKYISFDHDTVTEDLDFTYKLHKNKLKIVYDSKAIIYTQDPGCISSYIGQMRRWYGGGWQNLMKNLDRNLLDNPRMVLELSLIYIEGIIYSLLFFILPVISLDWASKVFTLLLIVVTIEAIYAAFREKRSDMLAIPFVYPIMMFVNSWISLEQFVVEGLGRKKNLQWFHPARREM